MLNLSELDISKFILDHNISEETFKKLGPFMLDVYEKYYGYSHKPVNLTEFIEDPHFMNAKGILYPTVMQDMVELNSGGYVEAVLTGAIGTGKTTMALYTTAYQLYLLSCLNNPHAQFDLDPASEILFVFQSINASLAKAVDYMRFKAMIDSAPYFKAHYRYDTNIGSEMRFPNRVIVKPISGTDTAAIGQNVMGGIIDELNFMAVTNKSKLSVDGGQYDQAVALYTSLATRRKSRFMQKGVLPGILCLVSSKRYPGQFTDLKEAEASRELQTTGKTTIFIYAKRLWEVAPEKFTGNWFQIFVGDESRQPRILEPNEVLVDDEKLLVMDIPLENRNEFEVDIMRALRDIAGVSTLARHPYITDRAAVSRCFGTHKSVLSRDAVDFKATKLQIYPSNFQDRERPRWVHIDLAVTGDSAGVSMGYIEKFTHIERSKGEFEILPVVYMDFSLEVKPPKGGEILFFKIRALLYKLRDAGLNIKWVSLDSYQSTDTIQILRQKGFTCGTVSVDTTTVPYDVAKSALYDGRILAPKHDKLQQELIALEVDVKKGKIDHTPQNSKDVADSFTGVVYGLTTRTELWLEAGIALQEVPTSVAECLPAKELMKAPTTGTE